MRACVCVEEGDVEEHSQQQKNIQRTANVKPRDLGSGVTYIQIFMWQASSDYPWNSTEPGVWVTEHPWGWCVNLRVTYVRRLITCAVTLADRAASAGAWHPTAGPPTPNPDALIYTSHASSENHLTTAAIRAHRTLHVFLSTNVVSAFCSGSSRQHIRFPIQTRSQLTSE